MRLDTRLLDGPPREGARAVVLALVDEAAAAAEVLREGTGEEPLHDFRVALRRVRSALRSYAPWLGPVRRKHVRKLKELAASTNASRDAEVQRAWLEARRAAFASGERHAGWKVAVARAKARARSGPGARRVAKRFAHAAGKLRCELAGPAPADRPPHDARFADVLAALARERAEALSERVGAIRGAADRARIHRARIAGKRLRYLVEPLRAARPEARAAVSRLKALQDVLGELHDAHVLEAELRAALRDARPAARPGLRALAALAREARDARFAELGRAWARGAPSGDARALAAALRRGRARAQRRARLVHRR